MYLYIYIYTYIHIHICVFIYIYICVCIYIYDMHVNVFIYTHIYSGLIGRAVAAKNNLCIYTHTLWLIYIWICICKHTYIHRTHRKGCSHEKHHGVYSFLGFLFKFVMQFENIMLLFSADFTLLFVLFLAVCCRVLQCLTGAARLHRPSGTICTPLYIHWSCKVIQLQSWLLRIFFVCF